MFWPQLGATKSTNFLLELKRIVLMRFLRYLGQAMVRLPAQNVKLRTLEKFLSSRFRPLKSFIFGDFFDLLQLREQRRLPQASGPSYSNPAWSITPCMHACNHESSSTLRHACFFREKHEFWIHGPTSDLGGPADQIGIARDSR